MALVQNKGTDPQGNPMAMPISGPVPNGITSVPLAENGVYTTGWFFARGYTSLYYLMFSNVVGSIKFEYSEDGGTSLVGSPVTVQFDSSFANLFPRVGAFAPRASFIRITYTNGPTIQANFNLIITLLTGNAQPSLETMLDNLTDTRLAMVVKAALQAKDVSGVYDFVMRTGNALRVNVDNLPLTQAVSLASIPLATGAATSAKQDSMIASAGAVSDSAITNPASSATQISLLKGLLTLLSGPLLTTGSTSANASPSSVAIPAGSSTTILAANTNRRGATIQNIGSSDVFVSLGSTASSSVHTVALRPNQRPYYEVPANYVGVITAFSATATSVQVTQLLP